MNSVVNAQFQHVSRRFRMSFQTCAPPSPLQPSCFARVVFFQLARKKTAYNTRKSRTILMFENRPIHMCLCGVSPVLFTCPAYECFRFRVRRFGNAAQVSTGKCAVLLSDYRIHRVRDQEDLPEFQDGMPDWIDQGRRFSRHLLAVFPSRRYVVANVFDGRGRQGEGTVFEISLLSSCM